MGTIRFFTDVKGFRFTGQRKTSSWIRDIIVREGKILSYVNFVFCTDDQLAAINVQYLKHKTFTDIITFDLSASPTVIEGEVYISIDRVQENATIYKNEFDTELHRVIIHGILHLLGYNDKTSLQKSAMRKKEDACLSLR